MNSVSRTDETALRNEATGITAAAFGIIFGISGMVHGFFETLQGNVPTGGLFINAIGESNKMWLYGDEPAFTVIPNFLITGIVAIISGFSIIVWSLFYLRRKTGPLIFTLLFILLFLTGGGVAQILFFIIACAFATRINKPLKWWKKALPAALRIIIARFWLTFLIAFSILMMFSLEIANFGFVPGISNPDSISSVMMTSVLSGLAFLIPAFISGFAYDISKQDSGRVPPASLSQKLEGRV